VVVSHADPIRVLLAHVLGVPLDLFQRITIAPASISAVAFRPDGVTVLTVNSVDEPSWGAPKWRPTAPRRRRS
jgi:probable phosphoglycerate mutase